MIMVGEAKEQDMQQQKQWAAFDKWFGSLDNDGRSFAAELVRMSLAHSLATAQNFNGQIPPIMRGLDNQNAPNLSKLLQYDPGYLASKHLDCGVPDPNT
jgi:hypothetical protein